MTKETLANHGNEEVIDVNQGRHMRGVRWGSHEHGFHIWFHVTLEKRFVNELRAPPCLQDVLDASYTIKRG
ncbi:unnamed protein product [Musa hybrid cultivar]